MYIIAFNFKYVKNYLILLRTIKFADYYAA